MGRYNEILVGRFNRYFQKLLSMKGPAAVAQLASDIQPVFPLNSGNEDAYLKGWNLFGFENRIGAQGGANVSAMRLRNPAGSGVIALVTKAFFFDNQNAVQEIYTIGYDRMNGVTSGDLLTITAVNMNWDSRLKTVSANQGSACRLSTGGFTGFSNLTWRGVANAGASANAYIDALTKFDDALPLLPGDALTFANGFGNTSCDIGIFWRERVLEDSETT